MPDGGVAAFSVSGASGADIRLGENLENPSQIELLYSYIEHTFLKTNARFFSEVFSHFLRILKALLMNRSLAEKIKELLHDGNNAPGSVELVRNTVDVVHTPVPQDPMAEQSLEPSEQHRLYKAQKQHHDHDGKIHEAFLVMNQQVGTRDAVRAFVMRGVPQSTLYHWAERGFEGLPPAGMLRQPGAGRPAAYIPATSRVVIEQLNLQASATSSHIGPLQVKAAFAEHARTHSWDGKRFMYSTGWARKWLNEHASEIHHGDTLTSKAAADSKVATQASLSALLSAVYEWRLQFALRHGSQTAIGLDLLLTASRMLNLDEVGLFLDEKSMFTVLLCTTASGHVHLVMVIFHGVKQLEDPLVYVDGVPFLVIYNDTHWNNSVAYRIYLDLLVQSLIPCRCGSPECWCFLLIHDRFPGHSSPEICELLEYNRIKPVVVEDTTRGAPNDFCFNKLIRDGFDERKLHVLQDRAKTSAARQSNGEAALSALSKEELRQLALYHLRHVIYDEHGLVQQKLRHSIQRFWKHTGVSLALDGSDVQDFGTKLQDGSSFDPPLPDLSAYTLNAESLPLQDAEPPDHGLLRMQAKRAFRAAVLSGEVDESEALAESTKKARRTAPAFDADTVSAVLLHTSMPLPGNPLPPLTVAEKIPDPATASIGTNDPEQKDDGLREDVHPQRMTDNMCARIRAGDVCYLCFAETHEQEDMACNRGCPLSFHRACYEKRWKESSCNKCPCHDCLVCLKTQFHHKCVGECSNCGADMHLACANDQDFYCVVCHSPVWRK